MKFITVAIALTVFGAVPAYAGKFNNTPSSSGHQEMARQQQQLLQEELERKAAERKTIPVLQLSPLDTTTLNIPRAVSTEPLCYFDAQKKECIDTGVKK